MIRSLIAILFLGLFSCNPLSKKRYTEDDLKALKPGDSVWIKSDPVMIRVQVLGNDPKQEILWVKIPEHAIATVSTGGIIYEIKPGNVGMEYINMP